jgi:hypothetical protein
MALILEKKFHFQKRKQKLLEIFFFFFVQILYEKGFVSDDNL